MNLKKKSAESNKILTKWMKKTVPLFMVLSSVSAFERNSKKRVKVMCTWQNGGENGSIFHDKCEFLPNIRNKKSTELVSFEQKVLRLNERYIKSTQEIINWHDSPVERRMYPESFKQNWTSFKQKAKRYEVDKTHGILFRLVKNSDGLHK